MAPLRLVPNATPASFDLIDTFLAGRYDNARTITSHRTKLRRLFTMANVEHPNQLTDAHLLDWITAPRANNTRRDHLSLARVFLTWCHKHDASVALLDDDLAHRLRHSAPRTYGKKQATNPARFLTSDEAERLIAACSDGTWIGSRDQLIIRFGLLGVRIDEIIRLRWRNVNPDGTLEWIGKKNRPRSASPGPRLVDLLARWKRQQERALGRPVTLDDPIVCTRSKGDKALRYDAPLASQNIAWRVVTSRAAAAGLGHVAPHDLRRSAAAILHRTRSADGGHVYDLLDIQQVLDHADSNTTQRSYLDHIDNVTKQNAGRTLDL